MLTHKHVKQGVIVRLDNMRIPWLSGICSQQYKCMTAMSGDCAGMAMPVWLSAVSSTPVGACVPALSTTFSGIMVLGIADSAASAIGRRYGRHRILGTRKTLEGTLSAVLCTVVGWLVLWPMCRCRGHENLDRCVLLAGPLRLFCCCCCMS